MKLLYALSFIVMVLYSCQPHTEKIENNVKLGQYIYRDDNLIHHIDANCFRLNHGKDDHGHQIYAKHLMDTTEFVISEMEYFRVCSHCVNDREYKHLLEISERNSEYIATIRVLYCLMEQEGYTDIGDETSFRKAMKDVSKREIVYNALKELGYTDIGENFDAFNKYLERKAR